MSDTPYHPAVDWSSITRIDGRKRVKITCPICREWHWDDAPNVRHRVKKGRFTGNCYKDRLLNKARVDRQDRPEHPQIDWSDTQLVGTTSQRATRVAITCPDCGEKRYAQPGSTAAKVRAGTFRGRCQGCVHRLRTYEPKPYLTLRRSDISPLDLPFFDSMLTKAGTVLAHRLVMANVLGRPLRSDELVDHQDGNHVNNAPDNLRLYLRGKNQPGSGCGYGTYYDEWQRAEARIRELEARSRALDAPSVPP